MKVCLNCKGEYQNKREASKFCSDKCRVSYNRKHPKKGDAITPLQMQVLYNSVLEAVNTINAYNGQPPAMALSVPTKTAKNDTKSFQQHLNDLSALETEYEYRQKAAEIEAATNLTTKQKELLLINMRQSKL